MALRLGLLKTYRTHKSTDLFVGNAKVETPRWKKRLDKERAFINEFDDLEKEDWLELLKKRRVTSSNHDTYLSIDWPHYCSHATEACGGINGWCYTFQGRQATDLHNRHAAMVDVLARKFPGVFGEKVAEEVGKAESAGQIPYKNIRFSGSGEMTDKHVEAVRQVVLQGVHAWGFSRSLKVAAQLRELGAFVIISYDATSPKQFVQEAVAEEFPLAYSSSGVADIPPEKTLVTFPVHKVGRVHEVADVASLCPKVLSEFFHDERQHSFCQKHCRRCHFGKSK